MTALENPSLPPDSAAPTGATPASATQVADRPESSAPPRPRRDRVTLWSVLGLLAATAVLYIWGLSASGWANPFYSAAAQAGSENLTAWFFGSLDGGNSITVDKPPAAIWLMALSVRLFGLNSWSILVPEALLGVASVGVLYLTLRRSLLAWAGDATTHGLTPRGAHWAAFAGALTFAITPVATLMFRFNNPDALLVFTMVLAAYCTTRAAEKASRGWLALAGVAIGLGFLTKMLQAFLVLPALVVAYFLAAPATWRKKIIDLLVACGTMIVSFGWYIAVVELTPTSARPYIGGSQSNSLLELIISYNGLGRITGNQVGSVGGGGGQGGGSWGETGITRLFDSVSGGMVAWLIPAALILTVAAAVFLALRWRRSTVPATGQAPRQALLGGLTLWFGWLVVTGLIFSFMAGIYHDYYTVALAPAIGASVALGAAALWADRGRLAPRIVLGTTSVLTDVWAMVLLQRAGGWYGVLGWVTLAGSVVAAVGILGAHRLPRLAASSALILALASASAGPLAYSIQTAATAHTGSIVTAGPVSSSGGFGGGGGGMGGGPGGGRGPQNQTGTQGQGDGQGRGQPPSQGSDTMTGPQAGPTGQGGSFGQGGGMGGLLDGASVSEELSAALSENADSFTWVAATVGSQNAASYQLAVDHPVMALGGFNGSDPSPTLEQFQQYVAAGQIHYFISGGVGGTQNGGSSSAQEIADWVAQNFEATTIGGTTVYDLTQG